MDYKYMGEDEILPGSEPVKFEDEQEDMNNGPTGDDDDITTEDSWTVISANFQEKGLVRQQLDSFDVFMSNTMQVSDCSSLICEPF